VIVTSLLWQVGAARRYHKASRRYTNDLSVCSSESGGSFACW